jgi:hypothetical protein
MVILEVGEKASFVMSRTEAGIIIGDACTELTAHIAKVENVSVRSFFKRCMVLKRLRGQAERIKSFMAGECERKIARPGATPLNGFHGLVIGVMIPVSRGMSADNIRKTGKALEKLYVV